MAALPQQALSFNDVFDEEEKGPSEPQTVHHIRANSSIMQLKKILGMSLTLLPCISVPLQLVPGDPFNVNQRR